MGAAFVPNIEYVNIENINNNGENSSNEHKLNQNLETLRLGTKSSRQLTHIHTDTVCQICNTDCTVKIFLVTRK